MYVHTYIHMYIVCMRIETMKKYPYNCFVMTDNQYIIRTIRIK